MRRLLLAFTAAMVCLAWRSPAAWQSSTIGVDEMKAGMIGVGRTVFAGDRIEEFHATVLGVLRNVVGPKRNLILAKLEGGPLAQTGVIQGMSGSPVYFDGRLAGAVSYALGSFPREPIAGITPIAEMINDVESASPRPSTVASSLAWTATPAGAMTALERLVARARAPLGRIDAAAIDGPVDLVSVASQLRPIGATFVLGGFDPAFDAPLRQALGSTATPRPQAEARGPSGASLQPGDPVGVSLIRGDLEMGATGTVTAVIGSRVYAFGHPFLNLGPTSFAMTQAHVLAVLPSLDSSMKIAALGPVVGAMGQDRTAGIGGTLGPPPHEVTVDLALTSGSAPERRFSFGVAHDPMLTPLFTYVCVLNALQSFERQVGVLSLAVSGSISFGRAGQVTLDDVFSGDQALAAAAAAIAGPVNVVAANEFSPVLPDRVDLRIRTSEQPRAATIERVWLDTAQPRAGERYQLQVELHHYRGDVETVSMPIDIPRQVSGPLTIVVSDGATLAALEQHELAGAKAASLVDVMAQLADQRHGNRLYVRLLGPSSGIALAGQSLPSLPGSVQAVLDADKSVAAAALGRAVLGAWDQRFDRAIRGSRELPITVLPPTR